MPQRSTASSIPIRSCRFPNIKSKSIRAALRPIWAAIHAIEAAIVILLTPPPPEIKITSGARLHDLRRPGVEHAGGHTGIRLIHHRNDRRGPVLSERPDKVLGLYFRSIPPPSVAQVHRTDQPVDGLDFMGGGNRKRPHIEKRT